MKQMSRHTITTREQLKVNGRVSERIATHIVTGVHGWETLCTSGCTFEHDEDGNLKSDAVVVCRDILPVTCHVCEAVWQDVCGFSQEDFCPSDQMSAYSDTGLAAISLNRYPLTVSDGQETRQRFRPRRGTWRRGCPVTRLLTRFGVIAFAIILVYWLFTVLGS